MSSPLDQFRIAALERQLADVERELQNARRWSMLWFAVAALSLAAGFARGGDYATELAQAREHRQRFGQADWPYHFYASVSGVQPDRRPILAGVFAFWVASGTRQPLIELAVPDQVPGTDLLHIDLRNLGWDWRHWQTIFADYPYQWFSPDRQYNVAPLVFDAAWFVLQVADGTIEQQRWLLDPQTKLRAQREVVEVGNKPVLKQAYNRLLLGKTDPTEDDFAAPWKINRDPLYLYGQSESNSGVSVNRRRWLVNYPTATRAYFWETYDFLRITAKTDPLRDPLFFRAPKGFDASELIAGRAVRSETQPGALAALQHYFLADGKGKGIAFAAGTIVAARRDFRRYADIVTPGGCVGCHAEGLIPPSQNEFRMLLDSGAVVATLKPGDRRDLGLFHNSPTSSEVALGSSLYRNGVKLVTGWTPAEAAKNFLSVVDWYDGDVGLHEAAWQLGCKPADVRQAIQITSDVGAVVLDARLSGMAAAKPLKVPRLVFEDLFPTLEYATIHARGAK